MKKIVKSFEINPTQIRPWRSFTLKGHLVKDEQLVINH
jgi:hypothetical protein